MERWSLILTWVVGLLAVPIGMAVAPRTNWAGLYIVAFVLSAAAQPFFGRPVGIATFATVGVVGAWLMLRKPREPKRP